MNEFNMTEIAAKTDEELVRYAQAGDMAAFNLLYERYLNVVYQRVRYSIPQADVEDVTQETFIAVIRSLKEFRYEAKFRTWLHAILGRKIADYYRRRDPADFQWVQSDASENDDPLNRVEQGMDGSSTSSLDDIIWVRQSLMRLPAHYREVILLRFVDGLSFSEIAGQLDLSLEATKSLFRRAISTLQQDLEKTHVR
jgi:RNA polymerase sigma-70 factor (ECF subfamily)